MSNAITNWLCEYPSSNTLGGGGKPRTRFIGSAVLTHAYVVNLYNLLMTSTIFDNWSFLFTQAKDWLTGLIWYPFPIPSVPVDKYYKFGPVDTASLDVNKRIVGRQPFFSVPTTDTLYDLGSTLISKAFNNYLDYNGYTQITVYLPYYGEVDISPNDVMGKYLFVNLYIDYYTGKGLYYISVGDTSTTTYANRRILVKKEVQLGYIIPLGSSNSVETTRNMVLGAIKTAGTIASLGLLNGTSVRSTISGSSETTTSNVLKQGRKNMTPKSIETVKRNYSNTRNYDYKIGDSVLGSIAVSGSIGAIDNAHLSVQSDKPNNPLLDMAGPKSVKVVIKRPKPIAITNDYNKLYGKPACYTAQLNTLTGFTTISAIHLEGFSTATKEELRILEQTLLGGIIL